MFGDAIRREYEQGRFESLVGDDLICKLHKDFSEMEKRYLESILEETIAEKGINVSRHCLKRMKERNYSVGKMQLVVRSGEIRELQLDKNGCRVLLSFASQTQFDRGFTSYAVYSLTDGVVTSVFQRQNSKEKKLNPETYLGSKKYLKQADNIIQIVNTYLDIENNEINTLMYKYDRSPLDKKSKFQLDLIINSPKITGKIFNFC